MDGPLYGILMLVFCVVLILLNIPIAFALITVGLIGFTQIVSFQGAVGTLITTSWTNLRSYSLLAIPLFVLMGQFMARSGVGGDLYNAASKLFGRLPGGLAISTVWGCGALAAATGSTTTGIMTFGPVAYKPMRELGYSQRLIMGCLCAGSTLGTVIPPSIPFVILGMMTGESVGRLFLCGVVPGLLEIVLYSGTIILLTVTKIWKGPPISPVSWKEKFKALPLAWPVVLIFIIVLGGIYTGFVTVTEASGLAGTVALCLLLAKKGLKWREHIKPALQEGMLVSGMMYLILIGASFFAKLVGISGAERAIYELLAYSSMSPGMVLFVILLILFALGFILPASAIIVILVPLLYPVVIGLGYSGTWFCVLVVVLMEMAAVTPPVGINLFLAQGLFHGEVPLTEIYKGTLPFVLADIVRVVIIVMVPGILLFL